MPHPRSAETAPSRELPQPKAEPATTMLYPVEARERKSGCVCFKQYVPNSAGILHLRRASEGASCCC